jgi:hypothetical protein
VPQPDPRRHQQAEELGLAKEGVDRRDLVQVRLEPIQHQQRPAPREGPQDLRQRRDVGAGLEADRASGGQGDGVRPDGAAEGGDEGSVGEQRVRLPDERSSQRRLADAAGTEQRDQADLLSLQAPASSAISRSRPNTAG